MRQVNEILESITDAFYAVDADWRLTYVNRRTEELWGRRRDELIGRSLWSLFPNYEQTRGYREHRRAMQERRTVHFEAFSPNLKFWAEVNIYPTPDGGLSVYFRDISDRKRVEEALRQSEERFRLAAQAAQMGAYSRNLQTGENYWSPEFLKIYGYGPKEDLPLIDGIPAAVHPEDRQRVLNEYRERFDRIGEPEFDSEHRIIRPNGEVRWVMVRGRTEFDLQGRPVRTHGFAMDITERRQAEDELCESEEKFSKAFYSSPSLLFICEFETGVFIDVNDAYCALTGYSRQEMIGRSSLELGLISGPIRTEILQRMRETGQALNIELEIVTRTGDVKHCLFSAETMEYRNRKCLIYSGVDITERKKAEEILSDYRKELEMEVKKKTAKIAEQYQMLQQLNTDIKRMSRHTIRAMENDRRALSKEVHDSIGGSLAAIKMLLEARLQHADQNLPDDLPSLEKIIDYLSETIRESKRISYQMRSMALDDFGLAAAVAELIRKFREFYPHIEVEHQIQLLSQDITDEVQTVLYRVIQEALNNIGKHSKADYARIALNESRDRIRLQVVDNGIGFDFSRTFNSNQPLQGYGMLSMKERVEICNGMLQVQSGTGGGTSLTVRIPKPGD